MWAHTCHLQGNVSTHTICKIVHTHHILPSELNARSCEKKKRDSNSFHKEPIGCINSPPPPPPLPQFNFQPPVLDRKQRGYQKSDPSGLIELDTARCLWFHTHSEPTFPHNHFFPCCRKKRFLKYPIEFGPTAPGSFTDTMVFRAPALGKTFTVHLKGTGL